MNFDWSITFGHVLTIIGFVLTMIVAYYSTQRDTDRKFGDVIRTVDERFGVLNVRLEKIFEGDIRELKTRAVLLEERHELLMKDVVERSHEIKNLVNTLVLKVDRLERPTRLNVKTE